MKYHDKNILIGITGGIAAYKTCEVIRRFVSDGAQVKVVMTRSAMKFITPLTVETLSGNKVSTDTFPEEDRYHSAALGTHHIDLARWADLVLICPATANIVGKAAGGIADDLLSTIIMATEVPVIFAQAMNDRMFLNPIYQDNVRKLTGYGYHFVDPDEGFLAEGYEAVGRLASLDKIVWNVDRIVFGSKELKGKKVLVTAGPTVEAIDPVRYLTNRSSGKMGFALARECVIRGAEVTLISGPSSQPIPLDVHFVGVRSAQEMHDAVLEALPGTDLIIKCAAVADFRPKSEKKDKIKKSGKGLTLELESTPDILSEINAKKKNGQVVVGFALETTNEDEYAIKKLEEKGLDMVVLNNAGQEGAGFESDTNIVTLFDRKKNKEVLPLMIKEQVAKELVDRIVKITPDC